MINDIIYAHQYARVGQSWLVVVVPPERHQDALTEFMAVVGSDAFGGRTLALQGGGKLSVASATDGIFVPDDKPFEVMFVGWGGNVSAASEMTRWRQAARRMVTRAA